MIILSFEYGILLVLAFLLSILSIEGTEYFFDKSISGRIEYSKNWATGKLEDLADVRLNKQHLLVSLAMSF